MNDKTLQEVRIFSEKYNVPAHIIINYIEACQIYDTEMIESNKMILEKISTQPEQMKIDLARSIQEWVK